MVICVCIVTRHISLNICSPIIQEFSRSEVFPQSLFSEGRTEITVVGQAVSSRTSVAMAK